MKKSYQILALLCFLLTSSSYAQNRHLIKVNALNNFMPFTKTQKVYFFNQYQFKLKNKWTISAGYGQSQHTSTSPLLENWLEYNSYQASNIDYINEEHFKNADIALGYNVAKRNSPVALSFGASFGRIWSRYDYLSKIAQFEFDNYLFVNDITRIQRKVALNYLGLHSNFTISIKNKLLIGVFMQLKIAQTNKIAGTETSYSYEKTNGFSRRSYSRALKLYPTFGVSLGYFLK